MAWQMVLNIGGAVLGTAVMTVVIDSVEANNGGQASHSAHMDGYHAALYTTVGFSGLGIVASVVMYLLSWRGDTHTNTNNNNSDLGEKSDVDTKGGSQLGSGSGSSDASQGEATLLEVQK